MNPKPLEEATDPLLVRSFAALVRARKRAEELAAATGTAVVDMVDGKLVYTYPGRKAEPSSEK